MQTRTKSILLHTALAAAIAVLATGCNRPADETMGSTGAKADATLNTAGTAVKTEVNDTMVTTSVKSALLADADVKSLDIKVETHEGQVALSGFVDSQSQIDRAVTVARGVDGVKGVQNGLEMKNGATTMGAKVDDGLTTTKVKAALLADSSVKGTDITVTTMDGRVQLSGFVDNQSQADRAIELAKGIKGVTDVSNELTIKK